MKISIYFFLGLFVASCAVHKYDRSLNKGMLDIVNEKGEVISGLQNIDNVDLSYSYKKISLKEVYLKQLKKVVDSQDVKIIRENYVLLDIDIKNKINLIANLNDSNLKKYLIQSPKNTLITGLSFLYKKDELGVFRNAQKITLTIKGGTPNLNIVGNNRSVNKGISDLLILDVRTSAICFGVKGLTSYDIIDVMKNLSDKCVDSRKIKLKKEIYEGF
ncbi:hypothetical protein ACXGQW_04915 [Wenyingzhuangia sp. IMCC45533]